MQPKILVTGGTGFLGSYLLRYLVRQGKKVRALKRPNSPMDLVQPIVSQVEWVEGDILDIGSLEDAMEGIEQVYHTAAVVSFDPREAEWMKKVNGEGTANVVNVALHKGVDKLLHVSSIAAIGRSKEKDTISENNKWERSKYNSQYAISKYQAEQEAWRGSVEGLKVVIINPSVILGSGFWDRGTGRFFEQIYKGLKFYTTGITGFVDVRDVARVMPMLMDSDIVQERFIISAENIGYQTLFGWLADSLQKPHPSIKVTPFLKETAWRIEWLRSKLTGSHPFITQETARNASIQCFYENDKLLKMLDFQYTPVKQTIMETGKQFLETGGQQSKFLKLA